MRIISIGTDKKILENGRVFDRVKEYSSLIEGDYFCYIFNAENMKKQDNFHAMGLGKKNKFLQIIKLVRELRKLKINACDILYPQDPFEIGLITYFISKIYRCKFYVQCHTDTSSLNFRNESKRNYLQYLISKFVFKKADKIRVMSKRMENYLVEELDIDKNKILELPIYFDSPKNLELESANSLPEGQGNTWGEAEGRGEAVDFLIISRLEPVKNIDVAVEAIKHIRDKTGQNLLLKIVGEGSIKSLLQEKYSDENFITFAPWSDNPTQEYQNAKYFLLPSLYEGWGMTVVESVAVGTPAVMTNVGCAHEFLMNFENGIVANGFDRLSFQEAIEKAMEINWSGEEMQKKMKKSLENLNTKQEYLHKLKEFLLDF